ncbi:hypothetical protein AQUCO_09500045v1 [Aquilegia coerulea]|uniref:Protein SDA1 n=1 Tax=Aquilegia coerulea TaxID=218851 RepID=A0A2G5C4V8_AQUCA|nr:hypothetical protein AQUCO_09500045v1 [Aquilegia coerulea]
MMIRTAKTANLFIFPLITRVLVMLMNTITCYLPVLNLSMTRKMMIGRKMMKQTNSLVTWESDGLNEIDDEEEEEEEESDGVDDIEEDNEKLSTRKRKFFGHDEQQNAEGTSLQAGAKAKKAAKIALANSKMCTFKIPDSEQLRRKRVDPAVFEARKKLTKEEKLESIRAGREERGKYQARAAVKQRKTGGLSNRQKAQKKEMPLAARRIKVARSRQEKKKKQRRGGKQFGGRKAWK